MDWDRLRYFYKAAKHGNMTYAAEAANLTQSAMSRQILALEHEVKAQLFHRIPRGLKLTKKGEILFEYAERIYTQLEHAQNLLTEDDPVPQGRLRVVTSPGYANTIFVPHVKEFYDKYPEMRLSIIHSDLAPDLHIYNADITIRPFATNEKSLTQEYLFSSEVYLYASEEYLAEHGVPEKPEDLDNHRLLGYGDHAHPFYHMNWHLSVGAPKGHVRTPYAKVNSGASLTELASQGMGITPLTPLNPLIKQRNLVMVLPHISGPCMDNYFIYPTELKDSKRVQAFITFYRDIIKRQNRTVKPELVEKAA